MTLVVELRDLKKNLPRPLAHFWQHATEAACLSRIRIACLVLLGIALGYPFDAGPARDGVLAMLCAVLTALVSATTGLVCDAGSGVARLFGDHSNSAFRLSQCFGEPILPVDISSVTAPFPAFSGHRMFALAACALFLFGCGVRRREPPRQRGAH
jgi:hypothetical protein